MNTKTLLRNMVEIYSPSGEEEKLVDFLRPEMEGLGFRTGRDELGNLIGKMGKGETQVLLVGHLDTVEGEIPVREEDGKLYGRGTVDAQSPLANFILSAGRFEGSEVLEVVVVGVVEEETTSKGALGITNDFSPDYVVVGEPSGWNGITLGYRGSIRISYSLELPKTHRGEGSPLPAEEAYCFYRQIVENFDSESSSFSSTDVRLTEINTENDPFQDSVSMSLDVRTSPGFKPQKLEGLIENAKDQATVETTEHIPPVKSSKRTRLVSAFLSAIRSAGGEPKFKLKTGTADMNIFAEHWNVPIVSYGPGNSFLDHTPREHLELEELSKGEEVLTAALEKLEKLAGP